MHGTFLSLCPDADPERARRVAEKLGIPFSVTEGKRRFQNKVIKPFLATYQAGRTPNPCVECNRFVKIALLLREADRLGIEMVATGHYAGLFYGENGRWGLSAAQDEGKDQSYFLWKLTQKQLSRLLFPLTGMEKSAVRRIGEKFVDPSEKESMEICFIPDGNTGSFLETHLPMTEAGDFVDGSGKVLGRHKGISRYTVGQRRGLGISASGRRFVLQILPEENRIVLGEEEKLLTDRVRVEKLHYVSASRREVPLHGVEMKGRNRGKTVPCTLKFDRFGVTAHFAIPVRRFAAGQSACFYQDGKLLFGGVIEG